MQKERITESFVGCEQCSGNGGFIFDKDNEGNPVSRKCSCLIEHQRRQKIRYGLYKAGIPINKVIDYSIDTYIGSDSRDSVDKLKQYTSQFKNNFHNIHLYIYGPNSTQKTTLVWWLGRELIKQDVSVRYVLMDDLVRMLTKEDFEADMREEVKKLSSVDCLILDESFDKDKVNWYASGYQLSFLDRFLRNRMEQRQAATMFVSNRGVNYIYDNFSQSVYELINRNTQQTQLYFSDYYMKKDNFEGEDIWKNNESNKHTKE